ncbi:MAG: TIGR03435 family protein, partial [Pyrinomonadaceae bacterium]
KREVRERDVLLLTMPKDKAAILQPSRSPKSFGMTARGKMTYKKHKIKVLADQLEGVLNLPVIDQTGLVGEFDWELIYNHADNNVLLNGVREKLGIEVTATKMQIEVLVVGKQSLPR